MAINAHNFRLELKQLDGSVDGRRRAAHRAEAEGLGRPPRSVRCTREHFG
jgi:hypothetical protein